MSVDRPVIVTGASGFVGLAIVRALRRSGSDFVALGRRPGDAPEGERWIAVDLLDQAAIGRVLAEVRPGTLIHAAWARTRPGGLWNAPDNEQWRDAGMALFDAFWDAGGHGVVACGTCAEYAETAQPCVEGETPIAPASLYGKAKAQLHELAAARAAQRGVPLAWARLFYLFGPNEAAARLVPSVIDSLLAGQPARTGSGNTLRDFAFIDDVAGGIVALAQAGANGAYNVAQGEGIMLKDLIARIGAIMGREDLLEIGALPDRPGEAPAITADVGRIARDTGWHAATPLDEALRQTIASRSARG